MLTSLPHAMLKSSQLQNGKDMKSNGLCKTNTNKCSIAAQAYAIL